MYLLVADAESPSETEQGADLEPRAQATVRNTKEALGYPVQVTPRRP